MAGLFPAIHVFASQRDARRGCVNARIKSGHDELGSVMHHPKESEASGVLARKRRCRQEYLARDRCGMSEVDKDFFLMANLFPADAGLAMVVWVSERGHARRDVRIKVNQSHGTRMLPGNLATVALRRIPRLIAGQLSAADMQAVSEWIRLNEAALVAYWEYQISTAGLMQQLRRLP